MIFYVLSIDWVLQSYISAHRLSNHEESGINLFRLCRFLHCSLHIPIQSNTGRMERKLGSVWECREQKIRKKEAKERKWQKENPKPCTSQCCFRQARSWSKTETQQSPKPSALCFTSPIPKPILWVNFQKQIPMDKPLWGAVFWGI